MLDAYGIRRRREYYDTSCYQCGMPTASVVGKLQHIGLPMQDAYGIPNSSDGIRRRRKL